MIVVFALDEVVVWRLYDEFYGLVPDIRPRGDYFLGNTLYRAIGRRILWCTLPHKADAVGFTQRSVRDKACAVFRRSTDYQAGAATG